MYLLSLCWCSVIPTYEPTTTTCTSWSLTLLLYLAPLWFEVRHGSDLYWVGYSRMNLSWVTPRWTGVTRTIKCQSNNGTSECAETSKVFCSWPWCDYAHIIYHVLSNHAPGSPTQKENGSGCDFSQFIANMPQDFCAARGIVWHPDSWSRLLFLVLLSEYDFDQDTFIALWNNCTFEEDHRKHHTSDCLGLKWWNISFYENTKYGLSKEEILNKW